MGGPSPFDDELAQQPEVADVPADDLKAGPQAERPASTPRADGAADLPVAEDDPRLQPGQVGNDNRAQNADGMAPSQPLQEDLTQRPGDAADLPVPEDDPRLQPGQVGNDNRAQNADGMAPSQPVQEDLAQRPGDAAALPVLEPDARPQTQDVNKDALPTQESDEALRTSERDRFPDLVEEYAEDIGRTDRDSPSDLRGNTPEENEALAKELADFIDQEMSIERHHAVEVFILRAIASSVAERDPASLRGGGEGFRQIVDDYFPQDLIEMSKTVHRELHLELNKVLDEIFAPERVGRQKPGIVERDGAAEMMEQLKELTKSELIGVLEQAYRRVFSEHPGIVSDDAEADTLKAIDDVRETLRRFEEDRKLKSKP